MLIQKINGFDRASISEKIGELVSVYTILSDEKDLKEPKETLKFIRAKDWISPVTLTKLKVTESKILNSETSPWNILGIPENTPEVNFIRLNEEEDNF